VKVEEVMVRRVVTLSPEDSVYDAAKRLRDKRISGAPVVEKGKVLGVVSEADIMELLTAEKINLNTILPSPFDVLELPLRMKLSLDETFRKIKKAATAKVEDIMTAGVVTVLPDADIAEAARLMGERRVNRLPVVDKEGKLVGIITRGDIIATF
jgi:CBS domain-containing protein